MSKYILQGKNLSQEYILKDGRVLKACSNIDFELKKGETLGIVGESGCGKSTLLKMATQLEKPVNGNLFFKGENVTHKKGEKLRKDRRFIQMVFQDPNTAFSQRMNVRKALSEPLKNYYKMSKTELEIKIIELLSQVGLPKEYIDRSCHAMSGGQKQRLGIARALALDPDVLVCDEATSALDVSIQNDIMNLLADIQKKRELSIMFVCHDIALVKSISHRIMVMYLGTVVEVIKSTDFDSKAKHPYSQLLLSSIFSTDMDFSKPISKLEGDVPSPLDMQTGCPFHSRCDKCMDICKTESPDLKDLENGHKVACHLY